MAYIRSGDVFIDEYLGTCSEDRRRGISLIIPLNQIAKNSEAVIKNFQILEPEQYYYPPEDLHITVFDYISAHNTYAKSSFIDQTYINITDEVIGFLSSFTILFKGVVFSREAGLLKGYDEGSVVELRNRIRQRLRIDGLSNTERYESRSVHSTFMRFTKKIVNVDRFVNVLEASREVVIGAELVKSMLLVEHDWYNRKRLKRTIKEYKLE
jgi:hypothetical protein